MTDVPSPVPAPVAGRTWSLRGLARTMEVDVRMLGMVVALLAIIAAFGVYTGGRFFQPVNLVNLTIQAVSIAIIATGMTLVIVSRNIDLSVGSIVGVVGMLSALLMARVLPNFIGFDHPLMWLIVFLIGLAIGGTIGAVQGYIVAYVGVPSFIVTLGGLLAFRGVTWTITQGVTISPVDPIYRLLGGGPRGSIGGTWSWVAGLVGCVGVALLLSSNRRRRRKFGFPLRPMWAEILVGAAAIVAILGVVGLANSYLWPEALARRYAEENGIPVPEGGLRIQSGLPIPALLLIGVTLLMHFLATRRRYGRYVFAIGGNPEASELAGINTKWTVMKTFILSGVLCAVAAAVAVARLDGATLDLGLSYELYVIAAAVIGGTSLAGGIGTIPGAVLGALVMSSLSYGLGFIGLSSPIQDIVAGIVLVVAVGLDTYYRKRAT